MRKQRVSAAIRIQRGVRLFWSVYKNFGPSLFVTSSGKTGQAGKICFKEPNCTASWVRVWDGTSLRRLCIFLLKHERLPPPEVLITVTGGAQNFEIDTRLQQASPMIAYL